MDSFSPEPTLQTLDLRLRASRSLRDETPAVSSPSAWVICYSRHRNRCQEEEEEESLSVTARGSEMLTMWFVELEGVREAI